MPQATGYRYICRLKGSKDILATDIYSCRDDAYDACEREDPTKLAWYIITKVWYKVSEGKHLITQEEILLEGGAT